MAQQQVERRDERTPARRGQAVSPLGTMRDMMDRWMDELFQEWPMMRMRPFEWRMQEFMPRIDVIDEDRQIRVNAEVPGMSARDIEITLTGDSLTLSGEKKAEREEEKEGLRYSERAYGSFHRSIPLPVDVDREKVEATFRNGVLSVVLPKSPKAMEQMKRIEIKST